MTIEQIREMVKGPEYEFLRTNPHLNQRENHLPDAGRKLFLRDERGDIRR